MSARGLALDCGEPDRPEEFPIFTDWWLGKPQKDDKELRLVRHSRQRELRGRV